MDSREAPTLRGGTEKIDPGKETSELARLTWDLTEKKFCVRVEVRRMDLRWAGREHP